MKKVLLVGGAGYIGSVLTDHLLQAGYAVRCLDLFLYQNQQCVTPFLNSPNYEFVFGDFGSKVVMEKALSGVSHVVLLGGLVGDPITKKYPEASEKVNVHGLLNAVQALQGKGLDRVVFVSTCSNYGLIGENELADENFPLSPLSLYAKAKVQLEQTLLSQRGKVDYHPTVLRFATAFGLSPRMRFDLTVNEFTREMFLKRDLLVFDAHTWRPYCHVLDFSAAIQRVLEAPVDRVDFEVFNVGSDANNFTKQMIIDEIKKLIPDAPVRFKEHGTDPRNYKVNFKKIQTQLDFHAKYSVHHGVQTLLKALEQNIFVNADERRNFHTNHEIDYQA